MKILLDIGGTYVRIAVGEGQVPKRPHKYEVAAFSELSEALALYCRNEKLEKGGSLRIACAGYHGGDLGDHPWIDCGSLQKEGWEIELAFNDFEAAAMALPHLNGTELHIFKGTHTQSETFCLIGPGTGLGLAYLRNGDVQLTCGGQMAAAGVSDEQRNVIASIQGELPILTYEELVSGRGLEALYKACGGEDIALENFLDHLNDPAIQKALRLFHEFFALFSANAVISGHATNGLFFTGGVMERLMHAKAFDFAHFEKTFIAHPNPKVQKLLNQVPIAHITYSYPALQGLAYA